MAIVDEVDRESPQCMAARYINLIDDLQQVVADLQQENAEFRKRLNLRPLPVVKVATRQLGPDSWLAEITELPPGERQDHRGDFMTQFGVTPERAARALRRKHGTGLAQKYQWQVT